MKRKLISGLASLMILAGSIGLATGAEASGVTYKDGDRYVKLGGRIQIQYYRSELTDQDAIYLRRLRPYIEGSVHPDWKGKFQIEFGNAQGASAEQEVDIKDAYLQYTGFEGVTITVGNANFPFSRELLTSSKYQQTVERTLVGDHNAGTPDRQLGVHLTGKAADGKVTWAASVSSGMIDPDATKLDFDTPVNRASDFNEGTMYGGRVDFHPFGEVKMSQGDFDNSDLKATVGVAAFNWKNDGDNNASAVSVDKVTGFEVSGAVRFRGASVDAEYNLFNVEAVDPTLTSGLYTNGDTKLTNYAVEGGYMVLPSKLELVASYQGQDADGYAKVWTRTELGANWFFAGHDIKVQGTYRANKNVNGISGFDRDEYYVQGQYVF